MTGTLAVFAVLVSTSDGERLAWIRNRITRPLAPTSSAATPTLLILDSTLTPITLMIVVSVIMTMPSRIAFFAKSGLLNSGKLGSGQLALGVHLKTWNRVEIWGRITCQASATAGTVTICAHRYIQPVFHDHALPATCFDHW